MIHLRRDCCATWYPGTSSRRNGIFAPDLPAQAQTRIRCEAFCWDDEGPAFCWTGHDREPYSEFVSFFALCHFVLMILPSDVMKTISAVVACIHNRSVVVASTYSCGVTKVVLYDGVPGKRSSLCYIFWYCVRSFCNCDECIYVLIVTPRLRCNYAAFMYSVRYSARSYIYRHHIQISLCIWDASKLGTMTVQYRLLR
jgi:hypothetical protein